MLVEVAFGHERLALDVADDHLVGAWHGPAGLSQTEMTQASAASLAHPSDFPPLRQAVVPGDRVVIALGTEVPAAAEIIAGSAQ